MLALLVPLLKELNPLLSVFTQGSISGFALIPPWALQECRAYGTLLRLNIHAIALATRFSIYYKMRPLHGLPKDKFYLFFGGALQNVVIARH